MIPSSPQRPFAVVADKNRRGRRRDTADASFRALLPAPEHTACPISAATREGLTELVTFVGQQMEQLRAHGMRDELLTQAKRIVVKIGSSLVASRDSRAVSGTHRPAGGRNLRHSESGGREVLSSPPVRLSPASRNWPEGISQEPSREAGRGSGRTKPADVGVRKIV